MYRDFELYLLKVWSHMTKSFGWQDNRYKCCPTKHHLQARDIKLLQMQRREVCGLLTQRPTHTGKVTSFASFGSNIFFYRKWSGLVALFSSGFLVTLSKSLFHFNYSILSVGAAPSCLRITGSFLFAFVDACLGSLLTHIEAYAHYFSAV